MRPRLTKTGPMCKEDVVLHKRFEVTGDTAQGHFVHWAVFQALNLSLAVQNYILLNGFNAESILD